MLKPILNYVLIDPIAGPEKIGAIHVLDTDKMSIAKGRVIAIGPGKTNKMGENIPITQIKVGDIVIYNSYQKVEYQEEKRQTGYVLINYDDLLGIWE